ncbi:DA1-related 1-like protein isoform X1 [Tanacetum coccineum]
MRRPRVGAGRIFDMFTDPYRLVRRCEVTAIFTLYSLPRGSILAHEMMHAWLRLKGFSNLPSGVEEGICQLLAHMWLDSEIMAGSSSTTVASSSSSAPIPAPASSKKGKRSDFENQFGELGSLNTRSSQTPLQLTKTDSKKVTRLCLITVSVALLIISDLLEGFLANNKKILARNESSFEFSDLLYMKKASKQELMPTKSSQDKLLPGVSGAPMGNGDDVFLGDAPIIVLREYVSQDLAEKMMNSIRMSPEAGKDNGMAIDVGEPQLTVTPHDKAYPILVEEGMEVNPYQEWDGSQQYQPLYVWI